jgi:hypothetical protein
MYRCDPASLPLVAELEVEIAKVTPRANILSNTAGDEWWCALAEHDGRERNSAAFFLKKEQPVGIINDCSEMREMNTEASMHEGL